MTKAQRKTKSTKGSKMIQKVLLIAVLVTIVMFFLVYNLIS